MRLHKYMAMCGVASRRKSEAIIQDGRVEVNGELVTNLGTQVDETLDKVTVDGNLISIEEKKIYVMLNKPLDCVTTSSDQFGRTTVLDYVSDIKERIYPVGRLDYNTTGLLILTNDGDLAKKVMHPSSHLSKVYVAKIKGVPNEAELKEFRKGKLDSLVRVEIYEGRNRQVRKMLDTIGHPIITLKRIAIGEIEIGNLNLGSYRNLSDDEIKYLKDY